MKSMFCAISVLVTLCCTLAVAACLIESATERVRWIMLKCFYRLLCGFFAFGARDGLRRAWRVQPFGCLPELF